MSRQRAEMALRGEATDCIPIFDMPLHPNFLRKLTGKDPFRQTAEVTREAVIKLDIDMLVCGLVESTTASEGDPDLYNILPLAEWRNEETTSRDLFSYDPQTYRGFDVHSKSEEEIAAEVKARLDHEQDVLGDVCLKQGFTFTTCIHYAAEDLNWEDFFIATVTDPEEIEALLDRFEAASAKVFRAHVRAGVPAMMSHDDIAMATGPTLSPDWLRKNIFPRYKRIWKPMVDAGIPIMFMSDGDVTELAEDVLEAGATGIMLDSPCVDLVELVSRCGRDVAYYTGPSPALMNHGSAQQVRDEMKRIAEIARDLPRFFWHQPGSWLADMPTENVQTWYECAREFGRR